MHRSALLAVRAGAIMRAMHGVHAPLQKAAEKSVVPFAVQCRQIASQTEANKAIKAALKSKKDADIIACLNKVEAHGFANHEVYDTLIRRLSKSNQWSALFYVLSHKSTQPGAQAYTPAQRELLINAYHRSPVVMWRETATHLQHLLAESDIVNSKVVTKALDVASRSKEIKNVLHVWNMLFQHKDKVAWDESILTPLAVAMFSSKNATKIAQLMQLVLESNSLQVPPDMKDVEAVANTLENAPAIGPVWLPVAISWLVFNNRVEAALELFASKGTQYPGDLTARSLVALSKLSQRSDLPAAVPVLFECTEIMLSQPAPTLSASSLHSLVHTCERLQNYPLAARLLLTGEAQGIQVDEGTLISLGRMLIRAQEYEAALELLQDRFQRRDSPVSHSAQALLLVCLFRLQRVEAMTALLDRMFSEEKSVPELVYQVATYGCVWNEMYEPAAELLQVYIDHHDLKSTRSPHAVTPLSSSVLLNGLFACAEGQLRDKALNILKQLSHNNTRLSRPDETKLVEYVCRACGGSDPQLLLDVLEESRVRFNDLVPNEQVLLTCAALCCRDGQWEAVPQFLAHIRAQGTGIAASSFVTMFEFLVDLHTPSALPDNSAGAEGMLDDSTPAARTAADHRVPDLSSLLQTFVDRLTPIAAQEHVDMAQVRDELLARTESLS